MFPVRQLLIVALVAASSTIPPLSVMVSAHPLPVPHVDEAPPQVISGQTLGLSVGFAPPRVPNRNLRAQHNGEDHSGLLGGGGGSPTQGNGNVISPGGGDVNPNTGVKNPGGILGPLYAAFPGLLAPLAMASDTIHNSNAAVSGVQHTPDGIFQA